MFFGEKLREFRLNYAKMGLHKFAQKIGMSVSELSNIERGIHPPPKCKKWIHNMSIKLGLEFNSLEDLELYYLWSEPFVMQKMDEDIMISPLTHKSDGTQLTGDEFVALHEHINSISKKHNKIADDYNREHHGLSGKNVKGKKTS